MPYISFSVYIDPYDELTKYCLWADCHDDNGNPDPDADPEDFKASEGITLEDYKQFEEDLDSEGVELMELAKNIIMRLIKNNNVTHSYLRSNIGHHEFHIDFPEELTINYEGLRDEFCKVSSYAFGDVFIGCSHDFAFEGYDTPCGHMFSQRRYTDEERGWLIERAYEGYGRIPAR